MTSRSYSLPTQRDLDALLQLTDETTHNERAHLVATTCRALYLHQDTERLDALLHALIHHPEVMYRRLGVLGTQAARHVDMLLVAAHDSSQLVNHGALHFLTKLSQADIPTFAILLEELAPRMYQSLLLKLIQSNDRARGTALLAHFLQHPPKEDRVEDILLALLPMCQDSALLEAIVSRFALEELPLLRLAQWRAEALIDILEESIPTPAMDAHAHQLCWRYMPSLTKAHAHFPERATILARRILPRRSFAHASMPLLRKIANQDASQFLDILASESGASILPRLRELTRASQLRSWPEAAQLELLRIARLDLENVAHLLSLLPPSRRGDLFEQIWSTQERVSLVLPDALLDTLPHTTRQQEARRMLHLSDIASSETRRQHYTAYLPPEEASDTLDAILGRAQADERARAWRLMVKNLALVREPLTPLLQRAARRLTNEQDPVRSSFLQALAALPGERFGGEEDGEALLTLLTHVVEARDTSWQTKHHATRLMQRILQAHARFPARPIVESAMQGLLILSTHDTYTAFPNLEAHLDEAAAQALTDRLVPWLESLSKRNYPQQLLHFTSALGKRAHKRARLQALIYDLIWVKGAPFSQAISLWLHDPDTREARVLHLLDRDPSTFAHRDVANYLHHRRQDLLTPYLQGNPLPKGLYTSRARVYTLPFFWNGFERWHTSQQELLAGHLRALIHDKKQPTHVRASQLHTLAKLPIIGSEEMQTWLTYKETPIIEAALGASVWLDSPEGVLELLLGFLSTKHARVAMYALQRQLQCYRSSQVLATIDAILDQDRVKITVQKEALRLLGDLGTPRAAGRLLDVWRGRALHKDVLLALVHATRRMLHHEAARTILDELAATASKLPTDTARGILDLGMQDISPGFDVYYLGVLLAITTEAEPVVSTQFSSLIASQAWRLREDIAMQARVAKHLSAEVLDTSDRRLSAWSMALQALIESSTFEIIADAFIEMSRALVSRATAFPLTYDFPDLQRDCAALVRVHEITSRLTSRGRFTSQHVALRARYLKEVELPVVLGEDTCALLAMQLFDLLVQSEPEQSDPATLLETIWHMLEGREEVLASFSRFDEEFYDSHLEPSRTVREASSAWRAMAYEMFEAGLSSNQSEARRYFLFECFLIAARSLDWPEHWRRLLVERRHDVTSPNIQRRAMRVTF